MIFWVCYFIVFVFLAVFAPFKVYGRKNILKGQNYIIVGNHRSNFDPILVDFVFRRRIRYLSKIELYKNKINAFFMREFGGIEFDRKKGLNLSQTKRVFDLINKKENIGIFPEGTRREDLAENDPVKGGACFFSIKTRTPIIPLYIAKKHKFFRKNEILVGKPFELSQFYDKKMDREVLGEAEKILKKHILELKDEYEKFANERKIVRQLKRSRGKK